MDVSELIDRLHKLADRQRRERGDVMYRGEHDPEISEAASELQSLSERIAVLEGERDNIGYHAEQLATYIAQSSISEKHLASARFHNDKIRASLIKEGRD